MCILSEIRLKFRSVSQTKITTMNTIAFEKGPQINWNIKLKHKRIYSHLKTFMNNWLKGRHSHSHHLATLGHVRRHMVFGTLSNTTNRLNFKSFYLWIKYEMAIIYCTLYIMKIAIDWIGAFFAPSSVRMSVAHSHCRAIN